MKINKEKGSIIVEAAIIYPFVLITILAMLVLCLIKMQDTIIVFATQRTAEQVSKEMSYTNYVEYLVRTEEDATVGAKNFPGITEVNNYYSKNKLYSEITKDYGEAVSKEEDKLETFLNSYAFLKSFSYKVNIDAKKGLFPNAIVSVDYSIRMPGFLRYIGLKEEVTIKNKSISYANNPSEFIRNVDIALDLSSFLLKKLGLGDGLNTFLAKLGDLGDKLK